MNFIKLIKNNIQHAFGGLFDTLSIERKLTDAQMECMQFGICDYAPRQVEEVPFFHYWLNLNRATASPIKLGTLNCFVRDLSAINGFGAIYVIFIWLTVDLK